MLGVDPTAEPTWISQLAERLPTAVSTSPVR
jgi:hypothetical protein